MIHLLWFYVTLCLFILLHVFSFHLSDMVPFVLLPFKVILHLQAFSISKQCVWHCIRPQIDDEVVLRDFMSLCIHFVISISLLWLLSFNVFFFIIASLYGRLTYPCSHVASLCSHFASLVTFSSLAELVARLLLCCRGKRGCVSRVILFSNPSMTVCVNVFVG